MSLKWVKEFETGNARLDGEHQAMFGLISRLQDEVVAGSPLESIELLLRELRGAAEAHFAWEERLMTDTAFPDAETHRGLHKMLLASLRDMVQEVSFGSLSPKNLLAFLVTWFATHTLQEDKELVDYVQASVAAGVLPADAARWLGDVPVGDD
jgi:hemerythrin